MEWEYEVIPLLGATTDKETLNELGREGWEMVAIIGTVSGPTAYLKRIPTTDRTGGGADADDG